MQINEEQDLTIEEFFDICKSEEGLYQIDTPDGWQDIDFLISKKDKECYNLVFDDGSELGCSSDHVVSVKGEWKQTINIDVQSDKVDSRSGDKCVVAKEYLGVKDTFDLGLKNTEHRYFSNDIISHNTGKSLTCSALASIYEMPLLRLDFGAIFGSLIGESETNMRNAIQISEAIAPCIVGDTKIIIDGSEISIEELFNKTAYDGQSFSIVDCKIESTHGNNIQCYAISRKKYTGILIRVTTNEGHTITVTEDHRLLVEENDVEEWKEAKDLSEKDCIVTGFEVPFETSRDTKSNIKSIERIDVENEYVYDPCCESPHSYFSNGFVSHNCIMWIDEVEKGIGGVQSSNQTDGGVTARVFGSLLTWMQEKKAPVFVICTANNISGIPPEFLRAGRFDEIFFLDLPDAEQREDITAKLLAKKSRNPDEFDIEQIVDMTNNYSPAEIEKGIDNAMFVAYADDRREVKTEDIVVAMGEFQPLYNGRRDEIESLRTFALGEDGKGGIARLANSTKHKVQTIDHSAPRGLSMSGELDL